MRARQPVLTVRSLIGDLHHGLWMAVSIRLTLRDPLMQSYFAGFLHSGPSRSCMPRLLSLLRLGLGRPGLLGWEASGKQINQITDGDVRARCDWLSKPVLRIRRESEKKEQPRYIHRQVGIILRAEFEEPSYNGKVKHARAQEIPLSGNRRTKVKSKAGV